MSHTGSVWRLFIAAMLTLGLMAAPASAAVTTSEVTSPENRQMHENDYEAGAAQMITVSGTTDGINDGTTVDSVDIRCYYGTQQWNYSTLASNQVVNADGTFSVESALDNIWGTCTIRALPSGVYPSGDGLAPFKGRDISVGSWNVYKSGGLEENQDKPYSFEATRPTFTAATGFTNYSNCGMWDMALLHADFSWGHDLFDCVAFVPSGFNEARSGLQVDGNSAYDSSGSSNGLPGYQGGQFSHKTNLLTGEIAITEKQTFVRCAPDPEAWREGGECSSHVPTGVALERTITQTHDGRQVTISDDYVSTDGAEHKVDAVYIEYLNAYYNGEGLAEAPSGGPDGLVAWYPWESSGFKRYGNYDVVSVSPEAPLTAYFKPQGNMAEGIDNPVGAITLNTTPDSTAWFSSGNLNRFKRTVPAGGKINVTHVFTLGSGLDATKALAIPAEDKFGAPRVAFTSHQPEQQVDSPSITVSGTARDTVGVTEFTINGRSVALGANGAWSTAVDLTEGTNTITAIAKDASGNVTQTQLKVGYKRPVVVTAPKPGQVKPGLRMKLSVKRDRTRPYTFVATGKVLAPQGTTGACATGGIVAIQSKVVRRTVSTRRVTVKKDCTFRVRVSFSKRARLGKGVVNVTPRFEGNLALSRVKGKAVSFRAG